MEAAGGYDPELVPFVKDPPDLLECPVCLLVLRNPFLVECCGRNFCETCIGRVRHANQSCPWCKADPIGNMIKDKRTLREVEALKVYCKQKDRGCEWTGELRYSNDHEGHCEYAEMECKYGCKERFIRREWEKHVEVCPNSPVDIQLKVLKRAMESKLAVLEEKSQHVEEELKLVPALQEQVAKLENQKDLLMNKIISQTADLQEAVDAQRMYKEQVNGLQQEVELLRGQLDQQSENIRATIVPKIHKAIMGEVSEVLVKETETIHSSVDTKLQSSVNRGMENIRSVVSKELESRVARELETRVARELELESRIFRELESRIAKELDTMYSSVSNEIHTLISREMAAQTRSEMVLPSPPPAAVAVQSVSASLPASVQPSSITDETRAEYQEQADLTALQVGLLRQEHGHKSSSTEKRLRALANEVAINRQAIAATLDKGKNRGNT